MPKGKARSCETPCLQEWLVGLGPEFKVKTCTSIGSSVGIELMEGKLAMSEKKYHKEFGATAALVIRMHEER